MERAAKVASTTQSTEELRATLQEVAIGEALFASTLATLLLTNQVATGRMSHSEVSALLDGATLVLERHRGAVPENVVAVDYARTRVTMLMNQLERMARAAATPAAAAS
jgi:hypothetical protein